MEGETAATLLQASLSKIRHHTNSKLENQKAPAQLLQAIESTLREQNQNTSVQSDGTKNKNKSTHQDTPSPNEYFLALDSMVGKASDPDASSSLLQSVLYLLSLVAPHVSPSILRARLTSLLAILSSVLSNPHPTTSASTDSQAALLRSVLTISQALFQSFTTSNDRGTLEKEMQLKGCWNSILNLCTDSRPKVRRRAQEIVGTVLLPDGIPTLVGGKSHPYTSRTAEWTVKTLEMVSESGGVSSKKDKKDKKGKNNNNNSKESEKPSYDRKAGKASGQEEAARLRQLGQAGGDGAASTGIWVCGFAKALVGAMPQESITSLCSVLLRLPALQNPFLTVASFEVFESLLKSSRPAAIPSTLDPLSISSSSTSTSASPTTITRPTLLSTLSALRSPALIPSPSDIQLIPSYLKALEQALVSYSRLDQGEPCWDQYVLPCWTDVLALTLSSKSEASRNAPNVRGSGRDLLSAILRYSIPDSGIEEALSLKSKNGDWKSETKLGKIINTLEEAISKHALRYQHSRKEILEILGALVNRLRYRSTSNKEVSSTRPPASATILLLPLIKIIGDLRSQPNFEHREYADSVLGTSVEVCGPASILSVLPLGLLGENGPTVGGRAWLLPLMRGRITNTNLSHFINEMLPLVEQIFNRKVEAEAIDNEGKPTRPVEAKVYEALVEQIWSLFPGYCDMPTDLITSFNSNFSNLLTNVLGSQSNLRPSIFKGLQNLVDRNIVLSKSSAPIEVLTSSFGLSQAQGKENLDYLRTMTQNLLASFFDVFAQSPGESRGYVAEALSSYLSIASKEDLKSTYEKVISLLNQTLPELIPSRDRETGSGSVPPLPHTMLDLLIVLSPHLEVGTTESEADKLFKVALENSLLKNGDSGIQKKTYRILTRLISGEKGAQILQLNKPNGNDLVGELLSKLSGATSSVVPGAKRDRIALLTALVPRIPKDEMHHLPSIIPEAVLGTKETNVGTREKAYELLVMMGEKMKEGGKVKKNLVEGANKKDGDEEEEEDKDSEMDLTNDAGVEETKASIEEYITMVCAGLAGTSPHMISATLTSLARLLYSFNQDLSKDTLSELIETLILFVSSTNREIVKASLGLSKVIILVLDTNLVDQHLPKLVPALLGWSKEHKQHFKSKVRHLFERLLRKFGFERIEQVTDEENRKLILNIKKRKERAKRRKSEREGEEEVDEEDEEDGIHASKLGARALKNHGTDAFEEAIYGSESEIDSDEDDNNVEPTTNGIRKLAGKAAKANGEKKSSRKNKQNDQAYILEDDDSPLDLLDRSAVMGGLITSNSSNLSGQMKNKRTPGKESFKFELDEATGRMIIDDQDSIQDDGDSNKRIDGTGRAYIEREQGLDGHTIGRGGAVKFNKNNKRTRNQEDEIDEMQMADEDAEEQRLADLAAAAAGGAVETGNGRKKEKKVKKEKELLGGEFRAKKAKGDVMKDGKSPYAYVPLSQVGGKKGKKSDKEVSLTGKGIKKQRR